MTGRDTSNMLFCYVCGLFKVAVIAADLRSLCPGRDSGPALRRLQQTGGRVGLGAVRAIDSGRI